jgi:cell division septum initiation protein DivIVA
MNNKQLEFLDIVSLGSAGLGIYNTILNQKQITNDELLKQINEYRHKEIDEIIEKVIEDNNRVLNEIKKLLERR